MTKKKNIQLSIFLIKEHLTSFKDVLRSDCQYTKYGLKPEFNIEGIMVVGRTTTNPPGWLRFIKQGTEEKLINIENSSNRAVIFVKRCNRLFVLSFGYGRYLLNDESYERDFGLRVALNTIDSKKIRSIDVANLEELTLQTRKQTSRSSSREAFGLDIVNDLMKAVTGQPKNTELASNITGRDTAVLLSKMNFEDITTKIDELYKAYKSDDYKKEFDWIDNLSEERDPSTIRSLEEKLLADLKNFDVSKMHLAPPELFDWNDIAGFSFNTVNSNPDESFESDTDITRYLDSLGDNRANLTISKLKKDKIIVSTPDSIIPKWKVFDSIVYETTLDTRAGSVFILTMGRWYVVEANFASKVKSYVTNNIPTAVISLPDCPHDYHEGIYNKETCNNNQEFALFDMQNIYCEGARTNIEFCDIFTKTGQIVHVKPKHSSSNLSHLFSQARISAESFIQDAKFREDARGILEVQKKFSVNLIPDERPIPSKYEIVFAIIDKSNKDLVESLPFFSLLNFMQTAKALTINGYKVSKIKVKRK